MSYGMPMALGGASLLGALGTWWLNHSNQKLTKEQMNFMKDMSNSAVSRSMQDMRKAGINPILAAGSPASTPSPGVPQLGNPVDSALSSAKSLFELKNLSAGVDQTYSNIQRNEIQNLKTSAQVQQMKVQDENIQSQTAVNRAKEKQIEQQTLHEGLGLNGNHWLQNSAKFLLNSGRYVAEHPDKFSQVDKYRSKSVYRYQRGSNRQLH